jgi:hypothetical protein
VKTTVAVDDSEGEAVCVECGAPATETVAELGREGWWDAPYCDDCLPAREEES